MNFEASTKDFLTACSKAARAAQKGAFETSELLLIEARGQFAAASGYNLTLGVSALFGVTSGEEGKIAVNAKILCGILKKAPCKTVSFEVTGDDITIKSGRSRFDLKGMSEDCFPRIPETEGDCVKVSADELNRLTRLTSFAAAKCSVRVQHTGIKMEFNGSELSCTALDGYRIAKAALGIKSGVRGSFIVPASAMNEAARLLSGDVAITFGDRHAVFYDADCTVFTRLLDGDFGNFDSILPREAVRAEVERELLADAVERVSVTMDTMYASPIECEVGDNRIRLSSFASTGSSSDSVECYCKGSIKIGLNNRYLLEALKAADTQRIKITVEHPEKPVMIEPAEENDFLFLVMPVRLGRKGGKT